MGVEGVVGVVVGDGSEGGVVVVVAVWRVASGDGGGRVAEAVEQLLALLLEKEWERGERGERGR